MDGRGVCVNAIAPGYMATDMNTRLLQDPKRNQEILGRIPADAGDAGRHEGHHGLFGLERLGLCQRRDHPGRRGVPGALKTLPRFLFCFILKPMSGPVLTRTGKE